MKRWEHTIGSRMSGLMRSAGILLLSAMSAVVLLSCGGSGDEPGGDPTPVPNGPMPIFFSGSLAESHSESHARTRATTQYLKLTHETFYAWAYKNPTSGSAETVMQDYTVNWLTGSEGTTASNSSGWEYVNQQPSGGVEQSIKYWDFDAADYRFFGYAGPKTSDEYPNYSCTIGSDNVAISFGVDVSKVVSGNPLKDPSLALKDGETPLPIFSKLWYKAKASLPAQKNNPVILEFLQPYSKVRFMFRQSEPETTRFILSEIHFKPSSGAKIYTKGTFKVTYPTTGEETAETWTIENPDDATALPDLDKYYYEVASGETDPVKIAGEKMWYVVLPAKDQGTYTLSLKVNGKEKNVVLPAKYMIWLPCYEYTYIFKITENGGVEIAAVQSAFTPWVTHEYSDSDEHPNMYEVYNW